MDSFVPVHTGLKTDNFKAAIKALKIFHSKFKNLKNIALHDKLISEMSKAVSKAVKSSDIKELRVNIYYVTKNLILLAKTYGYRSSKSYYLMYCPMARHGKGGYWIQTVPNVENPYFGKSMYTCGENLETIKQ